MDSAAANGETDSRQWEDMGRLHPGIIVGRDGFWDQAYMEDGGI